MEGMRESGYRMIMRATLKPREHSLSDVINEIRPVVVFEREYKRAAWTSQRFVARGGDYVAMLKGIGVHLRGDKSTYVRHIKHQDGTHPIGDFSQLFIIYVPGVGGET